VFGKCADLEKAVSLGGGWKISPNTEAGPKTGKEPVEKKLHIGKKTVPQTEITEEQQDWKTHGQMKADQMTFEVWRSIPSQMPA